MVETTQQWIKVNQQELTRFLKFAVVGTIGGVVDFGILYILHALLGWHLALANTVSFTCAVLSNFTWNRYWTYPDSRSKPISAQLGQFFAVNIVGWSMNTGILLVMSSPLTALLMETGGFGLGTQDAHNVGYNLAKLGATGVVTFWNFFINRYWTYNDVE